MSSNAATIQPRQGNSSDANFLSELLREQSQLSAVERFSVHHVNSFDDAVAEPAQAKFYQALLPATPPGPAQQYAFEVDLQACSGCKACVVACHTLNGLEETESWRRVGTITIGEDPAMGLLPELKHVTTACHHCSDPGCLSGCPVKAYDKDPLTGIVKHLDDQCIGCKYCTMMCPYEVPTYSDRLGIVRKCDMCQQRLSVGEAPACVQSCPNAAIAIRIIDVDAKPFSSSDRLAPGAPASILTKPSTRYVGIASQRLADAKAQDERIDHPAESHWPLAVMLVATQASVGILLIERLVSLIASAARKTTIGAELTPSLTLATTIAAFAVAAVGMGIAPLHLGQPLRAWRVFLGLRTSWLSREAILFGKYMGLLAASIALLLATALGDHLPKWISEIIPTWAASVALSATLVVGMLGLFSSGMIYVATRRQLWRVSRTMTRFVGSSLCLGFILVATVGSYLSIQTMPTMIWESSLLFAVGAASLCVKFAWEWKVLLGMGADSDSQYDQRSRRLVRRHLRPLHALRIWAFVATVGSCLAASVLGTLHWSTPGFVLAIAACGLSLSSELSERLLYFKSVVFDRMPGAIE